MNNIVIPVFADVFTVVQHTGYAVYADFTAAFGTNAFQIHFVGNFTHGRTVCIMLKCIKYRRSRKRINLKILLAVDHITDR